MSRKSDTSGTRHKRSVSWPWLDRPTLTLWKTPCPLWSPAESGEWEGGWARASPPPPAGEDLPKVVLQPGLGQGPGPTVTPPPHPACSPALHLQLPPEPSKASLSQGASLLPASQRGSRLKKRMWTEVGFEIRATGKTSSCQWRGLSSPTPGHLSVGGGHPRLGPGTPEGCCPSPALRPAGADREQSTERGALVLGWAAAAPRGLPEEVQREPVTARPAGLPPSRTFQQRSSTGWFRSCSGTSSGVPFLHLEPLPPPSLEPCP